ncbi:putative RNA methyltransferase-domain-containing protein [Protomyces lactucae-debilis]|uniref:Putative RNA methyltransferase-domain-containing protein n=1 Tax=Protomyces lactucae-debilis TaxID=2754530 RepID=A0A1Y2FGM2_PROLT|nr:putative RNA methyltransferase-domain-containing protein [Protomyces lactucae-debilis]ORY82564.1 putative RNA methyltransferase-domain-containing protein [Protomyces lactucae-debilis]
MHGNVYCNCGKIHWLTVFPCDLVDSRKVRLSLRLCVDEFRATNCSDAQKKADLELLLAPLQPATAMPVKKVRLTESPSQAPFKRIQTSQAAKATPKAEAHGSVAIAVPSSVVTTVKDHRAKTLLVGQVARLASLYGIDEIILYDEDAGKHTEPTITKSSDSYVERNDGLSDPLSFMMKLLSYLNEPPCFRDRQFAPCRTLRHVGVLKPFRAPHHGSDRQLGKRFKQVFIDKDSMGTLSNPARVTACSSDDPSGKHIEVLGTDFPDKSITVELDGEHWRQVSPRTPNMALGCYWGYQVRQASSLSDVIIGCDLDGGYNATIGVDTSASGTAATCAASLPKAKHLLFVFGGERGIPFALKQDPKLEHVKPEDLFDYWISPFQQQSLEKPTIDETINMTLAQLQAGLPKRTIEFS